MPSRQARSSFGVKSPTGFAASDAGRLWRTRLTVPEIAAQLGCSPRTVDRKLALIQTLWSEEIES